MLGTLSLSPLELQLTHSKPQTQIKQTPMGVTHWTKPSSVPNKTDVSCGCSPKGSLELPHQKQEMAQPLLDPGQDAVETDTVPRLGPHACAATLSEGAKTFRKAVPPV